MPKLVSFGGQSYQIQRPVCHAAVSWRRNFSVEERIRTTASQHYRGCPAMPIDPRHLDGLTAEQAVAKAAGRQ
jgi:hypothetical protein